MVTAVFLLNGFLFYKIGTRIIDKAEGMTQEKRENPLKDVQDKFFLSFESPADMGIFQFPDSGAELSKAVASEGKQSLLVEFPSGGAYPGMMFEVMGKDCLNWSDLKEFSFDVFNSSSVDCVLTVKLKSGEKYPKRDFERNITIPPMQWTTIRFTRDELAKRLDLSKISYLNMFMHDPRTTFKLYFDNMRVLKE